MISSEEPMQISDDDNVNETENRNIIQQTNTSETIETIVIDDENLSQRSTQSENNNIIIINDNDCKPSENGYLNNRLDNIYRENKLLAEFVEKCLGLEHTEGMLRVINKNLLKAYKEADEKYKKSSTFERLLGKGIGLLETEPLLKFSHVKNVYETLKCHGTKKRANLITLATNLKENGDKVKLKRNGIIANKALKRQKVDAIIELDDDEKDGVIINLDDYQNDVIILDESMQIDEEKENKGGTKENNFLVPQIEVTWEPNTDTIESDTSNVSIVPVIETKVLPITYEPEPERSEDENMQKIKEIEKQIAFYKEVILKLDETEVDDDSIVSPYIQSEKYKAKIVGLYKELCHLTGAEPVKRRNVRLQVREGHPSGPVRLLEMFINNNIGSDGTPPFPDFSDVVKCVVEANAMDGLGWTKAQIMNEANGLFTQCGRALQKKRQRREWRDLLSCVKSKSTDVDPADSDPQLLAKLEENRRVALKKERDLLELYTSLQTMSAQQKPGSSSETVQGTSKSMPCNGDCNNESDLDLESPSATTKVVRDTESSIKNIANDHVNGCVNSDLKGHSDLNVQGRVELNSQVQANSNLQRRVEPKLKIQVVSNLQGHVEPNSSKVQVNTNLQGHVDSNFCKLQMKSNLESHVQLKLEVQVDSNIQGRVESNFNIVKVDSNSKNFMDLKSQENLKPNKYSNLSLRGRTDSSSKNNCVNSNHADSNLQGRVELSSRVQANSNLQGRVEPKSVVQVVTNSQGQANSNLQGRVEPKSKVQVVSNSQDQANSNLRGRAEPKSEVQVVSNSQGQANSNLRGRLEPKSEVQVVSNSQGQANSNLQGRVEPKSEVQVVSNSQGQANSNLRGRVEPKSEVQVVSNSQGQANSNLQGRVEPKSVVQLVSNLQGHVESNSSKVQLDSNLQVQIDSTSQVDLNLQDHTISPQTPTENVPEVKIKKEPIDIATLLEELGDNFTSDIVDIIDPFLVIDISSDSSDEEDL